MDKLLTIVIPSYNMEKYIKQCLDSLIIESKLLNLLDILVINDGSIDSTSFIAHEYESKYPDSIRVVDKQNGNYGSCINVGIKNANGKYFRILDADDTYNTKSLETYLQSIQLLDVDMIITQYAIVNIDTHISQVIYPVNINNNAVNKIEDIDFSSNFKDLKLLEMHSTTFKLDVIRKADFKLHEGISYTDNEFVFYTLPFVKTVSYLNLCLYNYNLGREGQTVSTNSISKHFNDFLIITNKELDYYIKILAKNENSIQIINCLQYKIISTARVVFKNSILSYTTQKYQKFSVLYDRISFIDRSLLNNLAKSCGITFAIWRCMPSKFCAVLLTMTYNFIKLFKLIHLQ